MFRYVLLFYYIYRFEAYITKNFFIEIILRSMKIRVCSNVVGKELRRLGGNHTINPEKVEKNKYY